MKMDILKVENLVKTYQNGASKINAVDHISFSVEKGDFVAIIGASGSGKSTLINILGLIDVPTKGTYKLFNKDTKNLNDNQLSKIRMENIGFIFQDFQLNETLNAIENVMLPMTINSKISKIKRKELAYNYLCMVGLKDRVTHFPKEMSGGEQQRVAIARALANNPQIILADEPTGNLDANTEKEIFTILKSLSKKGKCIIVVSHSNISKEYADVVFNLNNGKLKKE